MSKFSKIILLIILIITFFYLKDNYFDNFNKSSVKEIKSKITTSKDSEVVEETSDYANSVFVYFLAVNKKGHTVFKKINRPVSKDSKLKTAIVELLKGPNYLEKHQGVYNEIPKGTRLLYIKETPNTAIIDLSSDFEYGGGTDSIYSRMRQIIKTALANEPNKKVYLYINGEQLEVIGGEGIMVSQPLSENSLDD